MINGHRKRIAAFHYFKNIIQKYVKGTFILLLNCKKNKWLNNKEIKCVGCQCPMVHFTISTDNINHTEKCPLWN